MADILSIGSSGLTAYRKSLEVTGSNIVNASTEGYARRDTVMSTVGEGSASPTLRASTVGSGVIVDYVRRASNYLLQSSVWTATAANSGAQTLADGLSRLERSVFSGKTTVGTSIQSFFSSLQDLAANPTSQPARLSVFEAAQQAVDQFHSQSNAVSNEVATAELNVDASLAQVNIITGQLAKLNIDIEQAGNGAQKSNDLLDQRDKLVGQLTKFVGVTVREKPSGAIDVFLGDTASGPQLVGVLGSKDLGSTKVGERMQIVVDPNVSRITTNQLKSGAVAGLLATREQALATRDNFNRLALAFADGVNKQHVQGVDLNGNAGRPMFSTQTLRATPAPLNLGSAKVTVGINAASSLKNDTYTATFDSSKNLWTVTSKSTNQSATGQSAVTLDGATFTFEGNAADRDEFTVAPMQDAASGMEFLLTDASQIAAALPRYADSAIRNTGTAKITLTQLNAKVAPPNLPQIQSVFTQSLTPSGALGVKRDGVVAVIPAGTTGVNLVSMAKPSSASFPLDATNLSGMPGATLQLSLDGVPLTFSVNVSTSINAMKTTDAIHAVANAVNAALQAGGYSESLVASSTDGVLRITALGTSHNLSTASITPANASLAPVTASVIGASQAADVRIFTREGLQLSGFPLGTGEALSFLTEANGFSSTAAQNYLATPSGSTVNYRGLSLRNVTSPLSVVADPLKTEITVTALPETDNLQIADDGTQVSGTRYNLAIAGLDTVNIAGNDVLGQSTHLITSKLETMLTAQATQRSYTGVPVAFTSTSPVKATFAVSVNGEANQVVFTRDVDANGALLDTGSFAVTGPSGLTMSLSGPPNGKVTITLPKNLSTALPKVEAYGAGVTELGLATSLGVGTLSGMLTASKAVAPATLAAGVTIRMKVSGTEYDVPVIGTTGTDATSGVSWTVDNTGALQLTSSDPSMSVVATSEAQRDAAKSLGFNGADLTLTRSGDIFTTRSTIQYELIASQTFNAQNLTTPLNVSLQVAGKTITLSVKESSGTDTASGVSWAVDVNGKMRFTSSDRNMTMLGNTTESNLSAGSLGFIAGDRTTVTSGSVALGPTASIDASQSQFSYVGHALTLQGSAPEDLIISVASTGGERALAVRYPQDLVRTEPVIPNIRIKILAADQVAIYDADDKTGQSHALALRTLKPGEPVSYLGLSFNLNGKPNVGDEFTVVADSSRSGDNRNALLMVEMQKAGAFGANTETFEQAYASAAAKLGSASQVAKLSATTTTTAVSDLVAQYSTATGVNMDAEAADLLRFQQAFQACAQVVSVARDLFNTIIGIRN